MFLTRDGVMRDGMGDGVMDLSSQIRSTKQTKHSLPSQSSPEECFKERYHEFNAPGYDQEGYANRCACGAGSQCRTTDIDIISSISFFGIFQSN
jgi:hypothetical protein